MSVTHEPARPADSYAHGVSDIALAGLTVGRLIEQTAIRYPDNEAIVVPFQDVRWTYRELNRQAEEMAAGLISLGLAPGERIGVCAPNMVEWVVLQFATAKPS